MEPLEIGKTILLVEDDPEVLTLNRKILLRKGFRTLEAGSLAEARRLLRLETVHLIILDLMLPDGFGLDFCAEARSLTTAPILMLTGLRSPQQVVTGLVTGGDDYLTKPYRVNELLARVVALLRREQMYEKRLGQQIVPNLRCGPLMLDTLASRAYYQSVDVGLTPKEFALLLLLLQNRGKVLSGKELYERVWGQTAGEDTRPVWTHISRLRNKLGLDGNGPLHIQASRGRGYYLVLEDES